MRAIVEFVSLSRSVVELMYLMGLGMIAASPFFLWYAVRNR